MAVMRYLPNPYRPPPTAEEPRRLEMDRVVVVQMVCVFHLFAALLSAGYLLMLRRGGNNMVDAVLDVAHFINVLMLCLSLVGFALVAMISITIPKWPRRFRVYLPSIDFLLFLLHLGVALQIRIA